MLVVVLNANDTTLTIDNSTFAGAELIKLLKIIKLKNVIIIIYIYWKRCNILFMLT